MKEKEGLDHLPAFSLHVLHALQPVPKSGDGWSAQFGLMKKEPVVEIVQIDRISGTVGEAVFPKDIFASVSVVDVAGDGGVECGDGGVVEFHVWLAENPRFKSGVGRSACFDEFLHGIFRNPEGVEHHGVVTLAATGIAVCQLADGLKGKFLPQARKMQDAEGTGGAGADEWNDLCHRPGTIVQYPAVSSSFLNAGWSLPGH